MQCIITFKKAWLTKLILGQNFLCQFYHPFIILIIVIIFSLSLSLSLWTTSLWTRSQVRCLSILLSFSFFVKSFLSWLYTIHVNVITIGDVFSECSITLDVIHTRKCTAVMKIFPRFIGNTSNPLYAFIMSRTRFRVNLHSIVAWMSRNFFLETDAISRKVIIEVFRTTPWTKEVNWTN